MAKHLDVAFCEPRFANARLLAADARANMMAETINPSDPTWALWRDDNGRTWQDLWHYWSGVADTYLALLTECQLRDDAGATARTNAQWSPRK